MLLQCDPSASYRAHRAETFAELSEILAKHDQPGGRIMFLYEVPGYYLFSKMRPSASCVWDVAAGDDDVRVPQWNRQPKGRGLVIRLKGASVAAFDRLVAPPERKLFETSHFVVFRDGD